MMERMKMILRILRRDIPPLYFITENQYIYILLKMFKESGEMIDNL